jgi:hypothetical protein
LSWPSTNVIHSSSGVSAACGATVADRNRQIPVSSVRSRERSSAIQSSGMEAKAYPPTRSGLLA